MCGFFGCGGVFALFVFVCLFVGFRQHTLLCVLFGDLQHLSLSLLETKNIRLSKVSNALPYRLLGVATSFRVSYLAPQNIRLLN